MSKEQKQAYANRQAYIKVLKDKVEELELDARYCKADFERKYYSIQATEIDPKFQEVMAKLTTPEQPEAPSVTETAELTVETTADANTQEQAGQ